MKHILCIESTVRNGTQGALSGTISTALPLFTSESVASVSDVITWLQEKKQGIVLVDTQYISLEDFATVHNTLRFHPQMALIAVLPKPDYALAQSALGAGAQDILAHPLSETEVRKTISRQQERIEAIYQEVQRTMHDIALKISYILPHEFRTPLNGLIGFISLLRQDALPEDEKPMAYRYLEASVNRLHQTAEKFLLYAELEQLDFGEKTLEDSSSRHFATYGMTSMTTEIAHETLDMFDRISDITFHMDDSEYAVQMRAQHVRFVIAELITNACKFSEARSPILLTMQHDETTCTISVQDKGQGFDAADLSRIGAFNQFGRERFEQQGVGFGLPIVQKILSLYGGKLDIRSKLDEGTLITIALPLAPLFQTEDGYAAVQYITMHSVS